jgi:hypothetical protein
VSLPEKSALPVDDPMQYAPFFVANPKQLNPSALLAEVPQREMELISKAMLPSFEELRKRSF